jgi:hypothetical protein
LARTGAVFSTITSSPAAVRSKSPPTIGRVPPRTSACTQESNSSGFTATPDLARSAENIRLHLEKINRGRTERITLRYFQHLAALYTEIFLDRLFNHRVGADGRPPLLADLNAFVGARNASHLSDKPKDEPFTEGDLTKLAYWMAPGSGKTLILHLNYYQFLHYGTGESAIRPPPPLDNILLITPNEGLSEQHLAELTAFGIPARRFDLNAGSLWSGGRDAVQVIEITKLVEEKRGGGVSVPVKDFVGPDLIFVDEGHKGSGGEAWRKYRDALGATGFTFEYSATFGQALSAARNDPLTAEYGKAILFDYSYRYFYGDGFGKDFRILNLRESQVGGDDENKFQLPRRHEDTKKNFVCFVSSLCLRVFVVISVAWWCRVPRRPRFCRRTAQAHRPSTTPSIPAKRTPLGRLRPPKTHGGSVALSSGKRTLGRVFYCGLSIDNWYSNN